MSSSVLQSRSVAPCCSTQCTTRRCLATHAGRPESSSRSVSFLDAAAATVASCVATAAPAWAESSGKVDFGQGGNADPKSYWTVLFLFLLSVPGLYSQVKRAPTAKIKRKTFEEAGPAAEGAKSQDQLAQQLFAYMKGKNYRVKSTGDVITFAGNYASDRGQAAAITFYMFVGMICCGLVLSIAAPGGGLWYGLVLLTPAAPYYYYKNADREEEFSIKMVTADDESTVDVVVQGDDEEITRMSKELGMQEKGMVYVPGIFEEKGEKELESSSKR